VLRTGAATNVVQLLKALDKEVEGEEIVLFYDAGVGALIEGTEEASSISGFFRRLSGLAFGSGIKSNVTDGYRFLMRQWKPEDKVYVFGFSRGAFTARALVALIHMCGLLPEGNDQLLDMKFGVFWRNRVRWGDPDWAQGARIKKYLGREIEITYMGLFDTVKTMGFWDAFLHWLASGRLRRLMRDLVVSLPFTDQLPNVAAGRHALSIDERRGPYAPKPWTPVRGPEGFEEVWFAGVHSDVGGGYTERGLSDITLSWVIEGAEQHGLSFHQDRKPVVTEANAVAQLHKSDGGFWRLLGRRHRSIPVNAVVHPTVTQRWEELGDYRPEIPNPPSTANGDDPTSEE